MRTGSKAIESRAQKIQSHAGSAGNSDIQKYKYVPVLIVPQNPQHNKYDLLLSRHRSSTQ